MNYKIVTSKQLGTNCWLAVRFCGGRCQRVLNCAYPEKANCKAVQCEIDYLEQHHAKTIETLNNQLKEQLKQLNK